MLLPAPAYLTTVTPFDRLLVVLPLLVAALAATLTLAVRNAPSLRGAASTFGVLAYAASVALLCRSVVLGRAAPAPVAYQVGGLPAPFGITLVADALAAFVLALTAAVAVPAVAFSTRYLEPEDEATFYHPLVHFLLLGVTGAVLAGDLFNLFVWFEVLLMATYVLIAFYGGASHTGASMRFLALNLVGSAVMLLAIGGIYGLTGTLNMADVARRLAAPAEYGVAPGPVLGLAGLLLAVFALKAGLVPFHYWVPSAYGATPLPATALLAGATKKVGLYAILRLFFTVFAAAELGVGPGGAIPWLGWPTGLVPADAPALAMLAPILLAMATGSVVVGGLGALQGRSLEEVLAYSSVGQVGLIAVPLAIAAGMPSLRRAAVAAALVFALHHALSKGTLFLVAAAIRSATGTSRLHALGGLAETFPALSGVAFVALLSLVGVPPLAGFFGKFLAFGVAGRAGSVLALGLLLGGSGLTIAYATRTWNEGFWDQPSATVAASRADGPQVGICAAMAVAVVAVGVGFEFVVGFAEQAADAAVDWEAYVAVVDPGTELVNETAGNATDTATHAPDAETVREPAPESGSETVLESAGEPVAETAGESAPENAGESIPERVGEPTSGSAIGGEPR